MSAPDSSSRPGSKKAAGEDARRARKRWGDRGPAGTPPSLRPARPRSCLARGTPVGHPAVVALRPGATPRHAAAAGPPRPAIDTVTAAPARGPHQARRSGQDVAQLIVVHV